MERRFDMSDFEQSLKDHADQFKMVPSKRVWNGIYNNLHPGSKWPSITIAILFLFTLITISKLNNSPTQFRDVENISKNDDAKNIIVSQDVPSHQQAISENRISGQQISKKNEKVNFTPGNGTVKPENKLLPPDLSASKNFSNQRTVDKNTDRKSAPDLVEAATTENLISAKENMKNREVATGLPAALEEIKPGEILVQLPEVFNPLNPQYIDIIEDVDFGQNRFLLSDFSEEAITLNILHPLVISYSNPYGTTAENNLASDKTINPLKKGRKNNKPEWTFYITPTISTASFGNKSINPSVTNSSQVAFSNRGAFKLLRNSRFGIETGTEMTLKIEKNLKFVTGFNLGYSGYKILSNLVHPTFATLMLRDKNGGTYSKNYLTHYGN
ncbi:MAG TPA: hypothetical protein VFF23_02275, partial [Hanamia sp.]|nr:hypothetical protein [Hanamia sp.]